MPAHPTNAPFEAIFATILEKRKGCPYCKLAQSPEPSNTVISLVLNNKDGLYGEIKAKLRGITIRNIVMAGAE